MNKAIPRITKSLQLLHVFPSIIRDPGIWLSSFNLIQRSVTLEEEIQLNLVENIVTVHDHSNHLERVHQFVTLENAHAGEIIDKLSQSVLDDAESIDEDTIGSRSVDGLVEDSHVRGQRVFIHGFDVRQTGNREEENRTSPGNCPVTVTTGLDLSIRHCRFLKGLRNLDRL